eukprot:5017001-Prymnesium_polylepis.2
MRRHWATRPPAVLTPPRREAPARTAHRGATLRCAALEAVPSLLQEMSACRAPRHAAYPGSPGSLREKHERIALQDRVEVELGLVIVAMSVQAFSCKLGVVGEQL